MHNVDALTLITGLVLLVPHSVMAWSVIGSHYRALQWHPLAGTLHMPPCNANAAVTSIPPLTPCQGFLGAILYFLRLFQPCHSPWNTKMITHRRMIMSTCPSRSRNWQTWCQLFDRVPVKITDRLVSNGVGGMSVLG